MHATEMLVAVLIPLSFFALVFGIVYMHKRENLAMIEKGFITQTYGDWLKLDIHLGFNISRVFTVSSKNRKG